MSVLVLKENIKFVEEKLLFWRFGIAWTVDGFFLRSKKKTSR